MYVALKALRVSVRDNGRSKIVEVGVGERIPGTDTWSPATVMANVNLGNVQFLPDAAMPEPKKSKPKTRATASLGG